MHKNFFFIHVFYSIQNLLPTFMNTYMYTINDLFWLDFSSYLTSHASPLMSHCSEKSILTKQIIDNIYLLFIDMSFSILINNTWQLLGSCLSYNYFIKSSGPSWPWSYGSWINNYLCNKYLSPLMLWFRISIRARCTTLCDKFCQWLATGQWFSPGPPLFSTNKTYHYDITEILLNVALNTMKQTNIKSSD